MHGLGNQEPDNMMRARFNRNLRGRFSLSVVAIWSELPGDGVS